MKELKYKVRFFFDYGAGGCLWADNEQSYQDFGFGPIDKIIAQKSGLLDNDILDKVTQLDLSHAEYLNSDYPANPSLWRQKECDNFNNEIDKLLKQLKLKLADFFEIIDKQLRYSEDPDLDEYLKDKKGFKRKH